MPDEVKVVEGQPGSAPQGASGAGDGNLDWSKFIPQEYASEKLWEPLKGKGLPEVLKGYAESQKYIGGAIRLPGPDAKPEEWDKFYAKLGRPEAPDKYEAKLPEVHGLGVDEEQLKTSLARLHKAGLTNAQVQAVFDIYGETVGKAQEILAKSAKEAEAELREVWGGAFDKNLALAKRTVREMGGESLLGFLESSGLANAPVFLRFLAKVGATLAEDGSISDEIEGVDSSEDAMAKINAIRGDKNHPYWNRQHPGHEDAVREMERLHQIAFPTL